MTDAALLMDLACRLYEAPDFVSWQAVAASLLVVCLVANDGAALDQAQRRIEATRKKWESPRRWREFLAPSLN